MLIKIRPSLQVINLSDDRYQLLHINQLSELNKWNTAICCLKTEISLPHM